MLIRPVPEITAMYNIFNGWIVKYNGILSSLNAQRLRTSQVSYTREGKYRGQQKWLRSCPYIESYFDNPVIPTSLVTLLAFSRNLTSAFKKRCWQCAFPIVWMAWLTPAPPPISPPSKSMHILWEKKVLLGKIQINKVLKWTVSKSFWWLGLPTFC